MNNRIDETIRSINETIQRIRDNVTNTSITFKTLLSIEERRRIHNEAVMKRQREWEVSQQGPDHKGG